MTNAEPKTTLGWERGRIYGAQAWRLDDTDTIAQRDDDGWSLYLEHELYGPEYVDSVATWQDVLDWVNSRPADLLVCSY